MTKLISPRKTSALTVAPVQEPGEDAVRAYAYHLFQQGSGAPGHDVDDWLEATACLKANIPSHASHSRLHLHGKRAENHRQLVSSPAAAKGEMATLRSGWKNLEAAPSAADFAGRTSLFDDRP